MITITSPGTYGPGDYILGANISVSSGNALVFSDTSTLNLNGFTIKGNGTGYIGILASGGLQMMLGVNGGGYIDGFEYGVYSNVPVTFVENIIYSNIRYIAATLAGHDSRFQNNIITGVGGDTTGQTYAVGVNVSGNNSIVQYNEFHEFYRQVHAPVGSVGEGVPIILNASCSGCLVRVNLLQNSLMASDTIGVFAGAGGGHIVRDNLFYNFNIGMQGNAATSENLLRLLSPKPGSTGVLLGVGYTPTNNTIVGYDTGINGPAGTGNVVV